MPSPEVVTTPSELRARCDASRALGQRVALVPTMGALHEGHLALVTEARKRADRVVVSIFVNPTQFGPNEDFAKYPRDLSRDVAKLSEAGVVFAPAVDAVYPAGDQTRVRVGAIADSLCGPHRPGHFEGVATVVSKLFGIVGPAVAVFGRKDYQQLAVIRRVVTDLFLPIEIVGFPIVREADGLALSSRNAYLSAEERRRALGLSRGLARAAHAFGAGDDRVGALRSLAEAEVRAVATSIDYVTLADADSLTPLADDDRVTGRAVLAIACRVGQTRLIDNFVLGEDPPASLGAAIPA